MSTTLVTTDAAWRAIDEAHGEPEEIVRALTTLRDATDVNALVFDERTVPLPPSTLEALGFRRVVRQYFVQHLRRVEALAAEFVAPSPRLVDTSPQSNDALRFASLQDATVRAGARELFARTHADTLEGFYFTLPDAPTLERCRQAFDAEVNGPAYVPSTGVAALDGETVVGFVYCTRSDPTEPPALAALAVSPAARRRGLATCFVRHVQNELIRLGFSHAAFLTTDRNAAIHKLFDPSSIVTRESYPVWFWVRA